MIIFPLMSVADEVRFLRSLVFPRPDGMRTNELSDAQIIEMGDAAFNAAVQAWGTKHIDGYNAADYYWSKTPPADICRLCFDWRRHGPGQRQFGYVGVLRCAYNCHCAHHQAEVWMA